MTKFILSYHILLWTYILNKQNCFSFDISFVSFKAFFFLRRNEYKYLAHHFLLVFCKRLFPPFGAFPWRRKSGALCFMEENPPPSKIRWKFMRSSRFSCFSTQFPSFPIIKIYFGHFIWVALDFFLHIFHGLWLRCLPHSPRL